MQSEMVGMHMLKLTSYSVSEEYSYHRLHVKIITQALVCNKRETKLYQNLIYINLTGLQKSIHLCLENSLSNPIYVRKYKC